MANTYVNKVDLADGTTLIDLSLDTVTADKLLAGYTAHGADGAPVTGSIPSKSASDVVMDGVTIKADAGYYASAVEKKLDSISINANETLPSLTYKYRQTPDTSTNGIAVQQNRKVIMQNYGLIEVSHPTQLYGDVFVSAYADTTTRVKKKIAAYGAWVTTNVTQAGTYYGQVVVPDPATLVYQVGSLWATEDSTKNPATELGFGTWTKVSPIEATWNRLKQTTTWAEMAMDAPTIYVWKRTA